MRRLINTTLRLAYCAALAIFTAYGTRLLMQHLQVTGQLKVVQPWMIEVPGLLVGIVVLVLLSRLPHRPERRIRYDPARPPDNGHDFEVWVAKRLRAKGWKAEVTRGSGDQGVDVIARRGRIRLGIQCKRYRGSTGNKAVQEIYAGQAFHNLTHSAVLTTGRYTKSARDLAHRTGVHLLTVDDLPKLDRIIR